jgi:hypothetical protein
MNIKVISSICLVALFLIAIVIFFTIGRILQVDNNVKIYGAAGNIIPSKVYARQRLIKNSKGELEEISELIVFFDEEFVDSKTLDVLVIVPKFKQIGIPQGDRNAFTRISNKIIYQKDRNVDNFTSVVNNFTYFEDPPIKYANFYNDRVVFNSYGNLKQFGDSIIIVY